MDILTYQNISCRAIKFYNCHASLLKIVDVLYYPYEAHRQKTYLRTWPVHLRSMIGIFTWKIFAFWLVNDAKFLRVDNGDSDFIRSEDLDQPTAVCSSRALFSLHHKSERCKIVRKTNGWRSNNSVYSLRLKLLICRSMKSTLKTANSWCVLIMFKIRRTMRKWDSTQ